jgi:hypothetical protein
MEVAMLVLTAIGVAAAIIAALPPLGIDVRIFGRPNMLLEGIPYFRARQAWTAITIAIISLTVSAGAFYYFFHPRIVEKIVEKPVEKIIPQNCPTDKHQPPAAPISKKAPQTRDGINIKGGVTQSSSGPQSPNIIGNNPQITYNGPPSWKLDATGRETLRSSFAPSCVVSVATDSDSKDLAGQLCESGRANNKGMVCTGPGFGNISAPFLNATDNAGIAGLGCYADDPSNPSLLRVQKSLAGVGLQCEYKGVAFSVNGLGFCVGGSGTTVVVGNMPIKRR